MTEKSQTFAGKQIFQTFLKNSNSKTFSLWVQCFWFEIDLKTRMKMDLVVTKKKNAKFIKSFVW